MLREFMERKEFKNGGHVNSSTTGIQNPGRTACRGATSFNNPVNVRAKRVRFNWIVLRSEARASGEQVINWFLDNYAICLF